MENKNHKSYCIVLPVYKEHMSETEKISLMNLSKVTNDYSETYLICPEGLNIDEYTAIHKNLHKIEFPKVYFLNIYTYNLLCMEYDLYNLFTVYDYMVLIQLDVYLFKNTFQEWVDMDYDYIGGPILEWRGKLSDIQNPPGYNGGFSIRKIKTFRYLTDPNSKFRVINTLFQDVLFEVPKQLAEDIYFSNIVPQLYGFKMKIPEWNVALQFSIDMPKECKEGYCEYTKRILNTVPGNPVGIHSFAKRKEYAELLKDRIPELTNEIISNLGK